MSAAARAPLAAIFGCAETTLTAEERRFFRDADPLGFILFHRNCRDPAAVERLVRDLRETVGRADAPVMIDQEGGPVQRFKPPHWPRDPAAARFGRLAARDPAAAETALRLHVHAIAIDLARHGITVNAAPVLDLVFPGASAVIGDRAFGSDPATVIRLGRAACEGYLAAGVLPIIKHLPGHGRAAVDSHVRLPVVTATRADLAASDFVPFRALSGMPWGMTAHVVYGALDPERPATLSPVVIADVIRTEIGFDGVLVSDDLCMGALSGAPGARAAAAVAAGCDIALHCNGRLRAMIDLATAVPPLSPAAMERLARAEALRRSATAAAPADPAALRSQVAAMLAAA